jgi:hypothetical protein
MADRALPGDFEGTHAESESAPPAIDIVGFDVDSRLEQPRAFDGDGAMLGRVLIYASIIAVVVALIIWKRFV